jgi:outer membrane lipoprotein-sorting protein
MGLVSSLLRPPAIDFDKTEVLMLKAALRGCVFAACLGGLVFAASAQQVVHALTGTVSSIDDLSKTVIVFQDNGSQGQFKDMTKGKTHFEFDKKIALETTPADDFKKKGAYVIVFYFGDNDDRTAVALKNLGAGPFTSAEGALVKLDVKGHMISLKDTTGAVQTFKITDQTVAEGYMGVVEGVKFPAQKGDQVRIVASTESGTPTALFMREK